MTIVEKYKGKMIKKVSNTGVPKEEYNALTNQVGELNNQVNNLNNNLANKEEEINNGKEIIANAIGEPLNSEDTFSAMSADINSLLSQFKTNMMNNGITVESSDKFKQLIDKIATMVEEDSGKGIQFASGSVTGSINVAADVYSGTTRLNTPIGFTPTFVFIKATSTAGVNYTEGYKNYFISNLSPVTLTPEYNQGTITLTITGISSNSINLKYERNSASNSGNVIISDWYAIGVGEEDTTLRDSLASILENKGVDVTEEDDMASLISKVDEEFDNMNDEINEYKNMKQDLVDALVNAGVNVNKDNTSEELISNMSQFMERSVPGISYIISDTLPDIAIDNQLCIITDNVSTKVNFVSSIPSASLNNNSNIYINNYTEKNIINNNTIIKVPNTVDICCQSGDNCIYDRKIYKGVNGNWEMITPQKILFSAYDQHGLNYEQIYIRAGSMKANEPTDLTEYSSSSANMNNGIMRMDVTLKFGFKSSAGIGYRTLVDLTNYNTLTTYIKLQARNMSNLGTYYYPSVLSIFDTSGSRVKVSTTTGVDSFLCITVDVSDLTGEHYILYGLGAVSNDRNGNYMEVYYSYLT